MAKAKAKKTTQPKTTARVKRGTPRRGPAATAPKAETRTRSTGDMLRDTWGAALSALASAEAEMQRQIGLLLKRNKLTPADAATALQDLQQRFSIERKNAGRQIEASLAEVQSRLVTERKNLGQMVDDAVRRALVAFNIPSRREVAELTRKVDELSGKIDGFRGAPRRAAAVPRKRKPAVPRKRKPARRASPKL